MRARPPGTLTIKERVYLLCKHVMKQGLTAAEAAHTLDEKVGTTNWCLIQLMKDGKLTRKHNCGPRGGWGYFVKRKRK